jgi:hypothetical protein
MGQIFKSDGTSFAEAPEAMMVTLMTFAPATDAEALKLLRSSYPSCSLSLRLAALNFIMRRWPREFGQPYSPR